MRHRWAVVPPLVVVACLLLATRATALCIVQPIEQVVRSSDVVWLATVTDAHAAPRGEPGIWRLTARIDDVLKGDGSTGEEATVFVSSCGPFILPRFAREQARGFVGEQRLVFGSLHRKGEIVAYSEIIEPQGLSLDEQYEMALDILGQTRPTEPQTGGSGEPPADRTPWLGIAILGMVVVGAIVFTLSRRSAPPR